MMTVLCVASGFAETETFDFQFVDGGFGSDWTTTYTSHTVNGTIANVTFASANKQGSGNAITDIPVTKGQPVTVVLNDMNAYKITGVKFVCRQWGTKTQTITLNTSDDGSNFTATTTKSSNFTLEAAGLDTKAVRFTFSTTSNQVGIESLEITYSEVGSNTPAAPAILLNGEAPKAKYLTTELPLTLTISSNNGTTAPKMVYTMGSPTGATSGIVSTATLQLGDDVVYDLKVGSNTLYVQEIIGSGDTEQESDWASATFTVAEPLTTYTSLAEVNALAKDTEFAYGATTVVMGKKNKNMYIVMPDNTAGALIYDASNNWPEGYTFGKIIKGGWTGKMDLYNTKPEVVNPDGFELDGQEAAVEPLEITAADLTKANFGRYAVLKNMEVAAGGTMDGVATYDQFGEMTGKEAGTYDVYGVIGWNNNAGQFMPLEYDPVVNEVATPTITLDPAEGPYYPGDEVNVSLACETPNAVLYYSLDNGESWNEGDNFDVTETVTIMAKAVLGTAESNVATQTVTFIQTYTSLADVNELDKGTEFAYGAETVVMGKKNKQLYIVMPDNTAGVLIFDSQNNWPDGYTFGKIIKGGWTGKMDLFNTKPEVINPAGFELDGQEAAVEPIEITATDLKKANFGRYAVMKNMEVAADGTMTGVTTYDQFGEMAKVTTAGTYDVYGVIGWNNNSGQFMPLEYDPVETPTPEMTVTFSPESGYSHEGPFTAYIIVENAPEGATVYYFIQDEEENIIEDGEYDAETGVTISQTGYLNAYVMSADNELLTDEDCYAEYTVTEPEPEDPTVVKATIVFGDNDADATAVIDEDGLLAYITEGADYVDSAIDIDKVYKGATGLKFSSSKANGTLTLNFAQAFENVTKVEVNAKRYGTDAAQINGVDVTEEFDDYTIMEDEEELASLTLTATKRVYVKSITISYKEETPEPAKNVMTFTVPENCEMSVTLADGTPVVSGETEIEEGALVVMTIIPEEGYEVKNVKVTEVAADEPTTGAPRRAPGDEIEVLPGDADNTYEFNMPDNGVNVEVTIGETSPTTGIDDINVTGNRAVKYVNALGQVSDRPFKGINIVIDGNKATKVIK